MEFEKPKLKRTEAKSLPESWELMTVGDSCDLLTGFPFKGDLYTETEGIRVLRGENVSTGFLRWDTVKRWKYSTSGLEKYFLKEGDVVVGMDGSKVGQNRAQIQDSDLPLLLAQRVARLRAKEEMDQNFLSHMILDKRFEKYVELVQTGTSVPHISGDQIRALTFPVPPVKEQKAIAVILSSISSKIRVNQRMNETLEAVGQATFKRWFVDFEFPNEKGKPYKSSGGEMVNSQLGEIPQNWEVKRLEEVTEAIFSGGTPDTRNKEYWNGSCPWLSSGETSSHFIYKTQKKITEKGIDNSSTRMAKSGDIIIASAGQGKTRGQTSLCLIDTYINQSIVALRAKDNIVPNSYLFFNLSRVYPLLRAISDSHSIRGSLTTRLFKDLEISLPPFKIVSAFDSWFISALRKIHSNLVENETLSELRDILLPRLMSGKIRVLVTKEKVEAS